MNNMKKKLVLFASVTIALASCQTAPKEDYSWIKKGLDVASAQLQLSAEEVRSEERRVGKECRSRWSPYH